MNDINKDKNIRSDNSNQTDSKEDDLNIKSIENQSNSNNNKNKDNNNNNNNNKIKNRNTKNNKNHQGKKNNNGKNKRNNNNNNNGADNKHEQINENNKEVPINNNDISVEEKTELSNMIITIDDNIKNIGKIEIDTENILGYGSCGTVVFNGKYQNRRVAVKRIMNHFYEIAKTEINILIHSDEHPSIIRFVS
jgi:serine/threonine-protein kinase/endoribonuclease IRE1